MTFYIIFALFILGLIIGSFLNVVILRFNTGLSISRGRSKCFSCAKKLEWYELLPVFSFAAQKGRCRGCFSRISWQYPFVELSAAIALPLAYLSVSHMSPSMSLIPAAAALSFVLYAILFCLYIVIFVYDMRHKIIPDLFSYTASLVALALVFLQGFLAGEIDCSRLIAGPALFLFFFIFWAISRGRWMGLGDAKLALSIGWFLGMGLGIAAILFSFWIGALVVLLIAVCQKLGMAKGKLGLKSEVPFGPFMLIGFLIAYLFPGVVASFLGFLSI